jgi:hypothetical protein
MSQTLPEELRQLLLQIDDAERRAEAIVAGMSDDSVNARPASDMGWSVAQCLHHLAVINEFYLRGCLAVVQAAAHDGRRFDGLRPTLFGRRFVESMEPPVRTRIKARPVAQPAPTMPRDQLVPLFKASHDGYRQLVTASATTDVNRVIVWNPFFRIIRMRMSTILLIIPAHDRRHLWQAENVKRGLTGS